MQDTFARATHSVGRPSAARDDRVSCIQVINECRVINHHPFFALVSLVFTTGVAIYLIRLSS